VFLEFQRSDGKEGHTWRVFETKVLRGILGPKGAKVIGGWKKIA
jgi:hypothetical protein